MGNKLLLYCIFTAFIYSALFTVYFAAVVAAAMLKRKNQDPADRKKYRDLVIIVYSHNNEKTAAGLLEQLNKQDYPPAYYKTHIILDNCTDNSSNKLEFIGGAKLWRLSEDAPLGKDKAVSWILENLMSFKSADAYVFLNADRIVKTDFLHNINKALQEHDVITGASEIFLEDAGWYEKVFASVNKYNADIMRKGRSALGLAVPIDSDIAAIKHEVLEKVKCIDFKNADSELKYSFLLTKINYPPAFAPSVKTYISSKDYKVRRPGFLFKLALFWHCFNLNALSNFRFTEFLFSLFKPNPLILAAMIAAVGIYSENYYFIYNIQWAFFLSGVLAFTFFISLCASNMFFLKHIMYLASCPLYTLIDTIGEMTLIKKLFTRINKNRQIEKAEKISVPVSVTNGRSMFACTLELVSKGRFKKAVFKYKNKKQETAQHFTRMCDAVKNISDILDKHGFRMKICQSCAYFSPKIDGTDNMVKGYCNQKAASGAEIDRTPETLLWQSCGYFIPQEVNNVIDILKFVKK